MEDYRNIATLENVVEAQLLDTILTEREIPHLLQSYHDSAYDGMYQLQMGWGCITAPESCQKTILYILSGLRKDANRP